MQKKPQHRLIGGGVAENRWRGCQSSSATSRGIYGESGGKRRVAAPRRFGGRRLLAPAAIAASGATRGEAVPGEILSGGVRRKRRNRGLIRRHRGAWLAAK